MKPNTVMPLQAYADELKEKISTAETTGRSTAEQIEDNAARLEVIEELLVKSQSQQRYIKKELDKITPENPILPDADNSEPLEVLEARSFLRSIEGMQSYSIEIAHKAARANTTIVQYELSRSEFEVAGKKYRFVSPSAYINGTRHDLKSMLQDQRVLNHLVKKQSGIITPIH